jgi:hypothetical protein
VSDTFASVRADADPACRICGSDGWHWGWSVSLTPKGQVSALSSFDPVRLRCPCVDRRRQQEKVNDRHTEDAHA